MMPTAELAVEVNGLRKQFGPLIALDGVTLHVRRGEV